MFFQQSIFYYAFILTELIKGVLEFGLFKKK